MLAAARTATLAILLTSGAATLGCAWVLGFEEPKDKPFVQDGGGGAAQGGGGGGGSSQGGGGAAGGEAIWSRIYGDANLQGSSRVAVDGAGNVLTSGIFAGTLKLGYDTLISAGDFDVFVMKSDSDGNPRWSKRFGDAARQMAQDIITDAAGNIVVSGYFYGSIDFGSTTLQSVGETDIFLAKFDAQGNHVWSQQFGGPAQDQVTGIAVDRTTGDIGVIAQFSALITVGADVLTTTGNSDQNIFVAKLASATGDVLWVRDYGDQEAQWGGRVAIDPGGNLVISGRFTGSMTFDGTLLATEAGQADPFVARLDAAGNADWAKQYTGVYSLGALATDDAGNIFYTGGLATTTDLGCGELAKVSDDNFVVAKLDSVGNCSWSKGFSGAGELYGGTLALDAMSNVVVAGYFSEALNCGGDALAGAGEADMFVLKLSSAGERIWCKGFGGPGWDELYGVAVSPADEIVLAGGTDGSLDFGTGLLTSAGNWDIVLAKLAP